MEPPNLNEFWVLGEPESTAAARRRAKWNRADGLRYQPIRCPADPGHNRVGDRVTPLSVILPNLEPLDFAWTAWECLVQEPVVQYLRDAGFTGFEVVSPKVKFASWYRQPPTFYQLIPKGSAGMISSESGYKVLKVCPDCGLIEYNTKIDDPTRVIDKSKWDGSDFFRLENTAGWIFMTDRVVQTLRRTPFKGWKAYSLLEMKETFDIAIPGYTGE